MIRLMQVGEEITLTFLTDNVANMPFLTGDLRIHICIKDTGEINRKCRSSGVDVFNE